MSKTIPARFSGLASGRLARTAEQPRRAFGRASRLALLLLVLANGPALANKEKPMLYPETRHVDVVDERFGVAVADPYRWLENDARRDPEVALWTRTQNDVARAYLDRLPGRAAFRTRLTALFDHERLSAPEKRGSRYFFTRHAGLDNQPVLVAREGADGSERVLLDPNQWSEDGAAALAEWSPSADGTHVAFTIQDGGADWRTIRILDVESGAFLADELEWARFTTIAWTKDGTGFFYARNRAPEKDAAFEAPVLDHAIHHHRLGTPQSADRVVYAPKSELPLIHRVDVTPDGRFAAISSTALTGGNSLVLLDLSRPDWPARVLVEGYDEIWSLAGNVGTKLFLSTQEGAERGKVVFLDLAAAPDATFAEVVPERDGATLLQAAVLGDRLVVAHLRDVKTEVSLHGLDGTPQGTLPLPGIGSPGGFRGRFGDNEAFFLFTAHDTPTTVMRYDAAANASTVWAAPVVAADLDRIAVEQRFYASKDGTRVPVFLVRRRDVAGPAPTMLTGYGGFGIPMVPFFSPEAVAWVEQGGVYAVANLRGGGEYGKAWHEAGRLGKKQTVFDDFIAAGEFLKREGVAAPDGLAVHGGSNGGLLIGAVANQRPDLFAAALPDVGVMDMLRFDRFTGGQLWTQEFGSPAVEADFRNLLAYSPLHNIRAGACYPAILATTADTDDRVVPGHSFKYVAALQAADLGGRPRILRVETRAGHGAGKPTAKLIEQTADMWAFAAYWTGLTVGTPK